MCPHRTPLSLAPLEPRDTPAAPFDTLPTFDLDTPAVLDHARAIAVAGLAAGRRVDAFVNIGDSNSAADSPYAPGYLTPLGGTGYDPAASGLAAAHPELLGTLAAFRSPAGGGANSFARPSTAAGSGFRLSNVLPHYAGEVAATDAGVALIMIGTNDAFNGTDLSAFRTGLTGLVDGLAGMGVVPVVSTIPDTILAPGYEDRVRQVNQVIADVAADRDLPLWNVWRDLAGLPGGGLRADGLHLNVSPAGGGSFAPPSLLFAQNVRNLDALQVLAWFHDRVAAAPPEAVAPLPSWTSLAGHAVYAVGRGEGQGPAVSVYDAVTGAELDRFLAFDPGFAGGVRVAVGDVNGDGVPDVVAGAGGGGGPVVRVVNGTDGSLLASVFAFEPTFRGGVSSVAAADLDGDGRAEVVVGAGAGGGPAVAVFHGGDYGEVGRFFAFEPGFRGGVFVAAGRFAGIGPGIAAGAGVGGGPRVAVFGYGSPAPAVSFFAFDPAYTGGVAVAAGDFTGGGAGEVAAGTATGAAGVRVIDPATLGQMANFSADPADAPAGVRLGAARGAADGRDELLVGNGPGRPVLVQGYAGFTGAPARLSPDEPARAFGVYVG